ncbi:MAG: transglutaminase-like domain-containing protein [Patiriisocius sp.]|uniref:transglutaminase-like domain-containing protein n=1 Tax=Patiriisocius sp. TaxID=2822396 RepID=UPI003EF486DA
METSQKLKINKLQLALLFFLCVGVFAQAQESEDFIKFKEMYPEARAVRYNQESNVDISIDANDIAITQEFIEEDIYLNDAATLGSKETLSFSSFFEMQEIEASAFNFSNGKYREEEVTVFNEKDELDQSFYDDSKSINFIYDNLKKGSKTRLKYSEKVKNPRFLSPFYFGNVYPIANNKITIKADKDIKLRFLQFNMEGLDVTFDKTEKRGNFIYTWEVKNAKEFDYEPGTPSFKTILPHIIPVITSYTVKGEEISVLGDVADLYSWYATMVKDVNTQESSEELKQVVASLTDGLDSDLEKVKAIYYWTQQNIKYIAFEYALGGFIPREANDVFNKKYGDCKDNSSILKEMLKIAGLKGNLTWVGTRSIPYKYQEVPTPLVDNHMILSYRNGSDIYYLDATGRFTPIDFPTSFIQGKEVLIAKDNTTFEIAQVPIIAPEKNAHKETTVLSLQGNKLVGTSNAVLSGYVKTDMFNDLERIKSDSKKKEYYKATFEKGNNKFIIDAIEERNMFEYDSDLLVQYDFSIEDYARVLGDEIYINLNLNDYLSYFKTEDDRKLPIEYEYQSLFTYKTTFNIPEGYTVEYLPENVLLNNNYVYFSINYTLEGNQIIYEIKNTQNFLTLDVEQQKEVNSLIKKAAKAQKEVVVLKKI